MYAENLHYVNLLIRPKNDSFKINIAYLFNNTEALNTSYPPYLSK